MLKFYMSLALPPSVRVIERGWLNCNQILLLSRGENVLVDSGYCTHRERTLELLAGPAGLDGEPLERLVNTHCHSDHMGGNAAVASAYGCTIAIPAGLGETFDIGSDTGAQVSDEYEGGGVFPGDIESVTVHLGSVMMPKMMDAVTKKTQQGSE